MAGRFRVVALAVLFIGVGMGVAFGLGVAYGHSNAPKQSGGLTTQQVLALVGGSGTGTGTGGAGAGGAGAGGGGFGGGTGGGGGGAGNAFAALNGKTTAGKITAVQGQTVTIETKPGTTQKVNLSGTTTLSKPGSGAASDLKEGALVLINGSRKTDGSFDASSIDLVPSDMSDLVTAIGTVAEASGGASGAGASRTPAAGATPGAAGTPTAPVAPAGGR